MRYPTLILLGCLLAAIVAADVDNEFETAHNKQRSCTPQWNCPIGCCGAKQLIDEHFGDQSDVVKAKLMCTVEHESNFDHCVIGTDCGSTGLFQVYYPLFKGVGPCPGTVAGMKDAEANTKCARYIFDIQGLDAWYGYKGHCTGVTTYNCQCGPTCPPGNHCSRSGEGICAAGRCDSDGKTCDLVQVDSGCATRSAPPCKAYKCQNKDCVLVADGAATDHSCPLPKSNGQTVNAACYKYKCTASGDCDGSFLQSTPANPLGNCPAPKDPSGHLYDPQCARSYCDSHGQCAADVHSGTGASPNWLSPCPVPAQKNPQCYRTFCSSGFCTGEAFNLNSTCTPMASEVDTVDNPQCVYYTCGSTGTCQSHVYPNNRYATCTYPQDLCLNNWCLNGQCADHEDKRCGTPEGVCVLSHCDSTTGLCTTPVRNGNACCPNGQINTGEQCEPGLNGADAQCCVNCDFKTGQCNDGNQCTADTCVSGKCTSTFQAGPCLQQDASDVCGIINCVPDPVQIGVCQRQSNPATAGQPCGTKPDQCNVLQCVGGTCTTVYDTTTIGKACTPATGSPAPVCGNYLCTKQADGTADCDLVPDLTQTCSDPTNKCATYLCAIDNSTQLPICQSTPIQCTPPAIIPECYGPPVCNPATGVCGTIVPLVNVSCSTPTDSSGSRPGDTCKQFSCTGNGNCERDCPCGNGVIDANEQCDWGIPYQKYCCNASCQGCPCGNGKLDAGEQCDYNMPNSSVCCNSQCNFTCTCGNGQIDKNETCDPAIAGQSACCNATTCQGCPSSSSHTAALGAIAASAAAVPVVAAAAYYFMKKGASPSPSGGAGDPAASSSPENPLYSPLLQQHQNPLFEG